MTLFSHFLFEYDFDNEYGHDEIEFVFTCALSPLLPLYSYTETFAGYEPKCCAQLRTNRGKNDSVSVQEIDHLMVATRCEGKIKNNNDDLDHDQNRSKKC